MAAARANTNSSGFWSRVFRPISCSSSWSSRVVLAGGRNGRALWGKGNSPPVASSRCVSFGARKSGVRGIIDSPCLPLLPPSDYDALLESRRSNGERFPAARVYGDFGENFRGENNVFLIFVYSISRPRVRFRYGYSGFPLSADRPSVRLGRPVDT